MPTHLTIPQFRAWVAEAEANQRLKDYDIYENYYLGQFSEITLPKHIKDCMSSDVAVHANYCRAVIDTKVQYLCGEPVAITVESPANEPTKAKEAEKSLYQIYKNNGLIYRNTLKAIRILSKKGDVFLKVINDNKPPTRFYDKVLSKLMFWRKWDEDYANKLKVRVINPYYVYPRYTDDDYEELDMAMIKYYEIADNGDKQWRAEVWYPDVVQSWELVSIGTLNNNEIMQWNFVSEIPNKYGFIPIVHIANTIDDREFGISDLHDVTEIQDIFNKTLTDLFLVMDYQSFQRVFIAGAMTAEGKQWDISPGTVTELPNPEAKITVINPSAIEPLLATIEMLKSSMCQVSQTPEIALGKIQGGIPSGYALRIHYQPLENKANECRILIKDGFEELNQMIFMMYEIDGQGAYSDLSSEIHLRGGLPIDKLAIVDVHTKQLGNGTISKETAMEEEGVEDVEKELGLIRAEEYDVYGDTGQRARIEAEQLQNTIANMELTKEPVIPEELNGRT